MTTTSTDTPVMRHCPVCNCSEHSPHLKKGRLQIVRCAGCSMLFANPVDAAFVDGRFYDREGSAYYTSPEKLGGDFSSVRFRREIAIVRRYCKAGAILDVGCGTGAFLHQLLLAHPGDYSALGMDISGPALAHARSAGIPVAAGRFDQHDFHGARFDAITFWAVLEHVDSPSSFLTRAEDLLVPGGHCVVLVPNMRSLAFRILRSGYRYVMAEHVNYFTATTLRKLAERAPGLEVIDLKFTHFNPIVIWQDLTRPRKNVPAAERAELLARTNAWKADRRLHPVRWVYAAGETLLARLGMADNVVMVMRRRN